MPDIGAHELTTDFPVVLANFTATPTIGPSPLTVSVNNTSTGADYYSWNWGDGTTTEQAQPGTHIYATPGTYTITLTASGGGFSDTFQEVITVQNQGGGGTGCTNSIIANGEFNALGGWSQNINGSVALVSGQLEVTINGVGQFNQVLQSGLGVQAKQYTLTFLARGPAGAHLGVQLLQNGSPFNFLGLSQEVTLTTSMTQYSITFTATAEQNARFRFVFNHLTGVYYIDDVCLGDTSASGTITAAFTVTPTSGSEPLLVTVTDQSTATNGITSWLYDWGDNTGSGQQNPIHYYTAPGTYTITQTVTGPDGTATSTKQVTVNAASCPGNLLTSGTFASATGWSWSGASGTGVSGGEGLLIAQTIVPVKFWQEGLTITSGEDYNLSFWLRANLNVSVTVTVENDSGGNLGLTQTLNVSSNYVEYNFPFTASGSHANARVQFTLNTANATLRIEDACLLGSSFIHADFSAYPTGGPVGTSILFNDLTTSNNPVTTRVWEYSSNNGSSWTAFGAGAASPSQVFSTIGTYLVRLTATSSSGTDTSDTQTITIVANSGSLTISANPTDGCIPLSGIATQQLNSNGTPTGQTTWETRTGTTGDFTPLAFGATFEYLITNPVTVQIRAKQNVTYADGSVETLTSNIVTVIARSTVIAGFTADVVQGVAPLAVTFTNTSQNAASYVWNFGNSNYSTVVSPAFTFTNPGNYTVSLTATGDCGSNTISKIITVLADTGTACFELLYRHCGDPCIRAFPQAPGAGYVLVTTETGFKWEPK